MASLNLNLIDFWATSKINGDRVVGRVLHGGRMSGKSNDVAGMLVRRAIFRQETILCTRTIQNKIADSVYTLIKSKIESFGLKSEFRILKNEIQHPETGSVFKFYGTLRNVDEIKSMEGVTIWWHEEAHNITADAFNVIRPTVMRNPDAEMIFTMNPRLSTDFSYCHFIKSPPRGFLVRKINYDENYFLSADALDDIKKAFEEDADLADHIYNGSPLDNDDLAIIKRRWVMAAIDAHKRLDPALFAGDNICGYDVADGGDDKNAAAAMRGGICVGLMEFKAEPEELDLSAAKIAAFAADHGCKIVGYDCLGVGASSGIHLRAAGIDRKNLFRFGAGSGVFQPKKKYKKTGKQNGDMFENLKAQAWWQLADRLRATYNAITRGIICEDHDLISIDSSLISQKMLNQLIDDLTVVQIAYNDCDRVMVERKKDLKKRGIKSPNIGDAFIIANSRNLTKKAVERLDIRG